MKKRFVAIALATGLMLCGCGASSGEIPEAESTEASLEASDESLAGEQKEDEAVSITEDDNDKAGEETEQKNDTGLQETQDTQETQGTPEDQTAINSETTPSEPEEPTEGAPLDFISRNGYIEWAEMESADLDNTLWGAFETYNTIDYEYNDYTSDTEGYFSNTYLQLGDMGQGSVTRDGKTENFTYTLNEYPDSAVGKTDSGEDIYMYFYTFHFGEEDYETICFEIGAWAIYFWPFG